MAAVVRPFEGRDADDVFELYRSARQWFEEFEVTRDYILSSSERPDFRFQVAEDAGEIVGFIGALYFTGVGRAELGPIGIREGLKERGIGSMLTESMLGFLSKEGIRRVQVKVKANNRGALAFFIKMGFSHDAYLRRYTLKGEDVAELVAYL